MHSSMSIFRDADIFSEQLRICKESALNHLLPYIQQLTLIGIVLAVLFL